MSMENGRPQILRDLEAGDITAEEASARLAAIDETPPADVLPRLVDEDLPHVSDYRGNWQVPFLMGMGGMALALSKMADRDRRGFFAPLRRGFFGLIVIVSGLVATIAAWSRNARWLLVLIDTENGSTIRVSLPVPVHLLGRLLSFVRPFASREDARQLDALIGFIEAMQEQMDSPDGQPVIFDITEDKQRVRVYFM